MKLLVALVLMFILAGCSKPAETDSTTEAKSTMRTAVDGFTGKTAVDAGEHAKAEIRRISAEKDKDLEEVLGE